MSNREKVKHAIFVFTVYFALPIIICIVWIGGLCLLFPQYAFMILMLVGMMGIILGVSAIPYIGDDK